MGKRSKNRDMTTAGMVEITDSNTESQEIPTQKDKKNKRSKKTKIDTDPELTTEHKNTDCSHQNDAQESTHNIKNKKKRKTIEIVEENTPKDSNSSPNSSEISKESVENIQTNKIPKKIKFGEDGEPEDGMLKDKTEKSYLNDEEKAIQDNDIDQFCNDIDDEDNKQYESWISLLEQKLSSGENNSTKKKNRKKKKDKNKSTE